MCYVKQDSYVFLSLSYVKAQSSKSDSLRCPLNMLSFVSAHFASPTL